MGMTQTIYESIGGEQTVRELVDRFYDLMDTMPEAAGIRALHPETLDHSREKLFMFLTGWMGGPPLYVERFGHPRLRARHLPFPIGESERDQWLLCMNRALEEVVGNALTRVNRALEEVVGNALTRVQIARSFAQLADFMRNKES
jgi:hemoglobin